MSSLAMYDPTSVLIYLADIVQVEDVMDGTFITITKDTQTFTSTTSTDGQVYRKRSSNNNYTVSLVLSSSSVTSRYLQYMLLADQVSSVAKFPMFIKDTGGSTLFHATTCWVESQPDVSFSQSVVPRAWTIKCTGCTLVYGDNYGASSVTDDLLGSIVSDLPSLAGLI